MAAMAGIALPTLVCCPGKSSGAARSGRNRAVCCLPPLQAAAAECGARNMAAKLLVPLLAVAVVGGAQPAAQAADWLVLGDLDASTGQSGYQDLINKIKERKQGLATAPALEAEDEAPSAAMPSKLQQMREAAEKARQQREAEELKMMQERSVEGRAKIAAEKEARERAALEKERADALSLKEKNVTTKTHGSWPLFLSQLLLLAAAVGFGAAVVALPESSWKKAEKTVGDFVEQVFPVVDGIYAKAKPISIQALEKAKEAKEVAQPYVIKTWEAAKPAAAKAYEASKPLVKEAQIKATELLKQVQEKAKS